MEIQTSGKPIDSLLEKVLCMNILSSDYFKELYRLKTYHEVIDEIYNQVDHVEPWMTGNCRGPSTAFCLLYKFFTMKLTVKQMHGLLRHPDSPYIRAIGFLYLRYAADPKTLWGWFEPYLKDEEEFSPGSNGRVTTMGVYIRDLLLGQAAFYSRGFQLKRGNSLHVCALLCITTLIHSSLAPLFLLCGRLLPTLRR
ncbi:PREDICTED: pre-mRNA-splicing factor 38B-like isoform X3 [Nelumbo nucifera]|uniref:Pre-mRNA-splicing factor 38 n=1 Tax=Nelumbo nucifera TaxID=4432 RepID=A0A1U8QAW9_NELNU|nr:PREDICTED: pre-mRNA-splicing factor 38B-like isoform X3 [Nelumbo nucifera]